MKQILSLWDACPQGGKHRRSVFLRLLLLVCMLATASAGWADTYYYGCMNLTNGALTPGTTNTTQFVKGGTTLTASTDLSLSTTPGTVGCYYNSSSLAAADLATSSNWGTGSSSNKTIRGLKFASGTTYTLSLGTKEATSITFYGWCGSASQTLTIGDVACNTPATQNLFFSQEFTKIGNFSGSVSISQTGDCYGILVIETTDGGGGGDDPVSTYDVTLSTDHDATTYVISATVGSAMPNKQKNGSSLSPPSSFSGYTFGGYYDDHAGGGTQYYTSSMASAHNWDKNSSATLYAKWTQTITLNANTSNHGSGSNKSATATYKGNALSGFTETSAAAGYILEGFYTSASGGTKVLKADGTFAAENVSSYITNNTWTKTGGTTLYAHYTAAPTELVAQSNKLWNFSDGSSAYSSNVSSNKTNDNLEMVATLSRSSGQVTFTDETNKSIYFSTSSTTGYFHFKAAANTTIKVYYYVGGTSDVDLVIEAGATKGSGTKLLDLTSPTKQKGVIAESALNTTENDIYIYNSGTRAVRIYAIKVEQAAATYTITKAAVTPTDAGSFTTTVGGNAVTSAAEGATVTVQAVPASGYKTSDIVVTKTTGGETVETSGSGNTRTFTMPAEGVTVTTTFAEITKQDVTLTWATDGDKEMNVGETYTNAATATASGVALGGGVTYTSDHTNVATVNEEGVVTAVGTGSATITASFAATTEYNAATSITYTVTVNNPNVAPSISTQPKAATYTQNATATPLSVTATGNPAPTYQWYSNTANSTSGGTEIPGATNATYTPSTATAGTTYYYCVATNSAGSATTNAVAVTVNAATARDAANPAVDVKSDSYGNHTFLDVANTTHNTEANSTNYLTYGAYYLATSLKPNWFVDNKRGSSSTQCSFDNQTALDNGFLKTSGPSSVTSGYGQLQLRQSEGTTFYVTGTTGVAILGKGGNADGKGVQISINEIAADGTITAEGSSAENHSGSDAIVAHASTLSPSKYYQVIVNGVSANNVLFYQIRFTQGNAADIVKDPTVVPTDENATFNATTKSVTFTTNEEDGTTYYVVGNDRVEDVATIVAADKTASGATGVDVTTQYNNKENVVISAVTKKGDKYSNIVYLNLAYNGPVEAKIGNPATISIQSGNSHTITPFITDANGKRLTFDQDEDASIDYSQYFDFTYAAKAGSATSDYITLTGGTVNTRVVDGETTHKAPENSQIVVTVTATPKANAQSYITNQGNLTKDITFTVTAEAEGDDISWCDLFWDEACTIPVSQNDGGVTGQAKAKSMVFTDFPNGKVIYVKVNSPATKVCFYYNNSGTKDDASVSNVDNMTSPEGKKGKVYRYRQCLPIYKNAQGAGLDGDKVWVTLAGYNGTAEDNLGDFINMEFTLKANSSRPAAPTYSPQTTSSESGTMKKMTTTQASTAIGDDNGTVMAKYSTNNSYTIIQLVSMPSDDNPRTLNVGKGSVGVFSTVSASNGKMRKTSGVQVVDGVISPMSNAYYSYYPAQKEVKLSFDPEEITVHTVGDHQFTKPTLNITAEDPSHVTPITYSIEGEAHGTTIDESTGALTFTNPTPGVVTVKASYAGDEYGSNSYAAAEATYTIYLIEPGKEVILIKPGSRNFTSEQTVVLEGAPTLDGYYTTSATTAEVPFNQNNLEGWTLLKHGTTTTLHLTETATVQAYVPESENRTQQTYTKITIPAPTLYPDGVTSTYYFTSGELDSNDKLAITAATTQAGASVYYVVDGDEEDLLNGGGTQYNGSNKIKIDGNKTTTIIYAVTRLADGNQSEIVRGVYTQSSDVKQPAFKVNDGEEFGSGETMDIATSDQVYIIDKSNQTGAITYYTVDGSSPTTSSMTYTTGRPFHINKSGTVVKAITVYNGKVSPISTATFNLTSGANRFWEANSSTCDSNGKLKINGGKSGAVINTTTDETNGVAFITATFGSIYEDSKDDWKHISIGEESKGDPIDGVGTYQIATGYNPQDENGDLYTHLNSSSSLKVHERTFKLPARGAYVRFEPEMDGDLTIWALQNGGVYYTDATEGQEKFLSGFIRKRPVYMIDEQGICQRATDIKAAGKLSDNWSNINRDNLLGNDQQEHSQSGVEQTLYKKAEAQTIYDMYSTMIGNASTDNIQDMLIYINDGTHQEAANAGIGTDTETAPNIGVCIPSASYMRYTYKVRAGKTYFFFAQRTKLGIRGFRFDPDVNPATENVTLDDTGANSDISTKCNSTTDNVTFTRTFTANQWTALLLPFSISATQVEQTFGEGTKIVHFSRFDTDEKTFYWKKHNYDMIVAGTPVLIRPTRNVTNIENLKVQIEKKTADDPMGEGTYTFNGTYGLGTLKTYDVFINNRGNTQQWLGNNGQNYKSLRAWITGFNSETNARSSFIGIDGEEDITTGIFELPFEGSSSDTTFSKGNNNVYSISGMLIRKNTTSIEGLPAGVYIINGKKVVIND